MIRTRRLRAIAASFAGPLAALAIAGCGPAPDSSTTAPVRVAVASNFVGPLRALASAFEAQTDHTIETSAASTGKLYAQIVAGAPFDLFLAADAARPERLVAEGLAVPDSLRRYATGRLVLVGHRSAVPNTPTDDAPASKPPPCFDAVLSLEQGSTARPLAIANPETAPYGRAARETLERLGLWTGLAPRLVRGANVSQVLQFVDSGNAAAGFVAEAQLRALPIGALSPCRWPVPATLHAPIEQKMVVLAAAADRAPVLAFARFLASEAAAEILRAWGTAP